MAGSETVSWLVERASGWLEKGLLSPRHVRRILQAEGYEGPLALPKRSAPRAAALVGTGLGLLAIALWQTFLAGPALLPWGARFAIASAVMLAAYAIAFARSESKSGNWTAVLSVVGLLSFAFAYLSLSEGIGLASGPSWAFLISGLIGIGLAWFLNSRLVLIVATLLLSAWMVNAGLYGQRFNPWFPLLALLVVFPLTFKLRSRLNLIVLSVALPVWLGLATKPRFSPVELFLPFTLVLWGVLWVSLSLAEGDANLLETSRWIGYVFLLGSAGVLSLHALGVGLAKAVLANPGWRVGGGLPLLVVNLLLSLGAVALWLRAARRGKLQKNLLMGLAVPSVAVWFYLLFPETIPQELAGSLLPDYFLVTPFDFGLIALFLLFGGAWHGYRTADGFLLYLSLFGLAALAGVRYFDSIWVALPKTTFLYLNGAGLLILWYALERRAAATVAERNR